LRFATNLLQNATHDLTPLYPPQPSHDEAEQEEQPEPPLDGVKLSPDFTPKTLNSFWGEPLPQPGHFTFSSPLTSFSNFSPQHLHLYS
jgi:hypothetical protein